MDQSPGPTFRGGSCFVTHMSAETAKSRQTKGNSLQRSPHTLKTKQGFPGGSVVKNTSANAGVTGSIPGPGRVHEPWNNKARAPGPLGLRSRAQEPQPLSSRGHCGSALEPEPCDKKSSCSKTWQCQKQTNVLMIIKKATEDLLIRKQTCRATGARAAGTHPSP